MKPLVLVVDDNLNTLRGIERALRREPYEIVTTTSPLDALDILRGIKVDVVVSDYKMPILSGIKFLSLVKQSFPLVSRLMITGEADVEVAMKAVNEGEVFRFFTKPFNDIDLGLAIRSALQAQEKGETASRLLDVVNMQSSYIEHLEKDFPGIGFVERDDSGAVICSYHDVDLNDLATQCEKELCQSDSETEEEENDA